MRSADLSGQVLENPLALEWGRRILEEFRLQASLEAAAGLPLTTVASGDMETTVKGQHFFAAKVSVGVGVGFWCWLYIVRSCTSLKPKPAKSYSSRTSVKDTKLRTPLQVRILTGMVPRNVYMDKDPPES